MKIGRFLYFFGCERGILVLTKYSVEDYLIEQEVRSGSLRRVQFAGVLGHGRNDMLKECRVRA